MSKNMSNLINEIEAAKILNLSRRTLQTMRQEGTGPAFIKLSERRLAYEKSEIERWISARRVTCTKENVG